MDSIDFPWIAHGISWISKDFPWTPMEFHGFQMISNGFQGILEAQVLPGAALAAWGSPAAGPESGRVAESGHPNVRVSARGPGRLRRCFS